MAEAKKTNALQKPLTPSPELAAVVGPGMLSRGEVVSKIWVYIKKNNLQDPKNKRDILADPFGQMARAGLFQIGLPGAGAALDSYRAIATAEQAMAAKTGLLGLASAFAARQMTARFFIAEFADAGANWISVHQEACRHLDRTIRMIQSEGARAGVVLNPATPVRMAASTSSLLRVVLTGGRSIFRSRSSWAAER